MRGADPAVVKDPGEVAVSNWLGCNKTKIGAPWHGFSQALLLLFLIGLSLVSQTAAFNADAIIAIRGFSAIEFVVANQNPEGFEQDFPGGSRLTTSNSPLTWLHLFASQLGLNSLFFYYLMVSLEILTLVVGLWVFWKALVSLSPIDRTGRSAVASWSFVAVTALVLLSNGQLMNLGRFGFPYFHGQFYGFADGLRLAAIGLALRKRWWESALLLSAAFVIHPTKGLFGAGVVLVIFLVSATRHTILPGLARLAIFPVVASFWSLITLARPSTRIDLSEFVAWTRVFQSHWYPFDLGVFTTRQFEYFVPFAAVVVLVLVGAVMVIDDRRLQRALVASMISLTALTAVGVALSAWPLSEFLVKLSLIRASELIVLLAIPMLVLLGILFFRSGRFGWAGVYAFTCLLFFLPNMFFNFLSLLGLAVPVVLMLKEKRGILARFTAALWGVFVIIHLVALTIDGGWFKATLGFAGALLAVSFLGLFFVFFARKSQGRVAAIMLITTLVGASLWTVVEVVRGGRSAEAGREYLPVQIWAQKNSPADALFMVDPCITYGWRDFSARASLGTPREWFMTGWLYSGDGAVLQRGKEISETLGLDLDPDALGPLSGSIVCEKARSAYYRPGLMGLSAISERFGVDYFVLNREELESRTGSLPPNWDISFENETYLVVERRESM